MRIEQAAVREACPVAGQHGTYSKHTGVVLGPHDELVHVNKRDGSDAWRVECRVCDTQVLDERGWPKEVSRLWAGKAGGAVRDSVTWEERRGTFVPNPPCAVASCGEKYTQLHHYAPQAVFGAAADSWPVGYLCVQHHHEWHTSMTGYVWQRPALARRQLRTLAEVRADQLHRWRCEEKEPDIDFYNQLHPDELDQVA